MTGLFGKILWGIFTKTLTETFVCKLLAIGAWKASQLSNNKVDDKMAEAFNEALGVSPEIYK